MRLLKLTFRLVAPALILAVSVCAADRPVWPPPPAEPRVEYINSIDCGELSLRRGFLGAVSKLVSGQSESDKIELPFDIVALDGTLFLVCQNLPALVEVYPEKKQFKLITDKEGALKYPVSLCRAGGNELFLSDSEAGTIYRFAEGKLRPFIRSGLLRPTGVAADSVRRRLYVADTGEHTIKVFDYSGRRLQTFGTDSLREPTFHFPTFVVVMSDGELLVNDALNYQIKRISPEGQYLGSFGFEGDVPGAFARPKGIASDSEGHIYVVDNLFDNIQIFNDSGVALLVIGQGGQAAGQFWSPAGIDIVSDTVYIADTYNNRIQALRYLGGRR